MRNPSNLERTLIEKLITLMKDDVDHYLAQVPRIMVQSIDEFGSLAIHVNEGSNSTTISKPIISGIQDDMDTIEMFGPFINLILFASEGKLTELQIYKDGGAKILGILDPRKIRVY